MAIFKTAENTLPLKKAKPFEDLKKDLEKQLSSIEEITVPNRKRPFLAAGSQCVALEDGHKKVLLVAPLEAAKGIELVNKSFSKLSVAKKQSLPFELPNLIGRNKPLHKLMNLSSDKSLTHAKGTYLANVNPKIITGTENVIYELTRYDGTLEDFRENTRFKSDSVDQILKEISNALNILHKQKLSHGDVALRNIFYTGTYPNFKFYLGDFGSAKPLSSNKENYVDITKDKVNLKFAITQLQEKLKRCPPSPIKSKGLLIQFNAQNKSNPTKKLSPRSKIKLSF